MTGDESGFAAERRHVEGEPLVLSPEAPDRWITGTQLQGTLTRHDGGGLPANGALDPASVVVRHGDRVLAESEDYLLDPQWAALGLGPAGADLAGVTVEVTYTYSLLRLDAVVEVPGGTERRRGVSALVAPVPPEVAPDEVRVANIYVGYHDDGTGERFDVLEHAADARTRTTSDRLPRTVATLMAGGRLRVACWGDSVTTGAEATTPDSAFPAAFASGLRGRFPEARVDLEVVAVGGTNSAQWFGTVPLHESFDPEEVRWQRVVDAEPDLLVVEFVNDMGFPVEKLAEVHEEVLERVDSLKCEVVVVTPHFTMASLMGTDDIRTDECRPQVEMLFDLADRSGWAVADASSRWAHLWREGVPYTTLLRNGINHPDDRGHALFVDELLKCVSPA